MACEVCMAPTGWVEGWKLESANESKRRAMEEARLLRETVLELLEILRQSPPGNLRGRDEATILQAMYRAGILTDPAAIVQMMADAAR